MSAVFNIVGRPSLGLPTILNKTKLFASLLNYCTVIGSLFILTIYREHPLVTKLKHCLPEKLFSCT